MKDSLFFNRGKFSAPAISSMTMPRISLFVAKLYSLAFDLLNFGLRFFPLGEAKEGGIPFVGVAVPEGGSLAESVGPEELEEVPSDKPREDDRGVNVGRLIPFVSALKEVFFSFFNFSSFSGGSPAVTGERGGKNAGGTVSIGVGS